MSQFKDAALNDTVYFFFAANTTTGTAGDGATPLFDVRLAGDTAGAAPILSGTPTLLTHANYTDGLHEIAVAATAANGFAAGNEYAVFCTLTISTVNPAGFVGSFKLVAAGKNLHALLDTVATDVAGLDGAAMRGTDSAALASAWTSTRAGYVDNLSAGATALASVCTEARLAELGSTNLPADMDNLKEAAFIRRFTAQAGAAGSITFDTGASSVTDFFKGRWVVTIGGTGSGQAALCTAYNGTTKVATTVPNWVTIPDVTTVAMALPTAGVDLEMVQNVVVTGGTPDVNVTKVGGTSVTGPNDLKADVTNLDVAVSTRASPADVNTQVDVALDTAIPASPTADSINERIAAIDNKLPSGTISDVTIAQVNTEVDTALADINLDHLVGTATAIPAVPAGTYLDQVMDDGTAVYDRTTDSLQAIRDRGDAAWTGGGSSLTAQEVRDAMKLAPTAGSPSAGSVDAELDTIAVDVAGLDGVAMRGTDNAALASVCTALRLAELDAANLPTDVANVKTDTTAILLDTGTDGVVLAANAITAAKIATDAIDADALAADAALEIADALLKRDVDQVEVAAAKHSLATAILGAVSKVIDDGTGNIIIYLTDGSTAKLTRVATTDSALVAIKTLGVGT